MAYFNLNLNVPNYTELAHSGFESGMGGQADACIKILFSKETIGYVSKQITSYLEGVDSMGRPIVVPDHRIAEVMSTVYLNFRPRTASIYGRYNIVREEGTDDHKGNIINKVIAIIVNDVKTNLGMEQHGATLSKWTTLLGDFNTHNLRSHAPIKIREKRPMSMAFNMNY